MTFRIRRSGVLGAATCLALALAVPGPAQANGSRHTVEDAPAWTSHAVAAGRTPATARHTFRAVLLLRLLVWFNPPLSYALALTSIRLPIYLGACAVALTVPVRLAALATSWFL